MTYVKMDLSRKPGCSRLNVYCSGFWDESRLIMLMKFGLKWVASQLQGPRLDPELGLLYVWSFCACSSYVLVQTNMGASKRTDYTKLPVD